MKAGPLSDPVMIGKPYLGRVSSINFFDTMLTVLRLIRDVSVYSEKVCIHTNKYLYPIFPGLISVKFASGARQVALCLAAEFERDGIALVNWQS